MGISSGASTSRRGYLSQLELKQFANITIQDSDEADDVISQAEEMIDAYVGYVRGHMREEVKGLVAEAINSTSFRIQTDQQNVYEQDYFVMCEVEIVGGTGAGQRRKVSASTKAGVITVADAFTTNPSTDSFYRIYQLGKFPRQEDVTHYNQNSVSRYFKSIPEEIKRATAFQVEFIKEMGDAFFNTDKTEMQSESIGDYSYTKSTGASGASRLISPRAQKILRGFVVRTGTIIA